jgi:hypothetical protein
MKRPLFPAFLVTAAVPAIALGLLAAAGCDPDLGVVTTPGEGGTEGGPLEEASAPIPTGDGGPTAEGGTDEGGTAEAGAAEHKIDGTNDFTAGEKFATSSPAYDAYVSWDDKKVYFGMSGADLGSGSSSKWVLVYVDGSPGNAGTPTGIAYDCGGGCAPQQASLPFNAGFHLRWKADNQYTNLQKWSGTAWVDVGPISTFMQKGTFWEVSLVRSVLGSPTKLKVHMSMLIEQSGAEWTYAGLPSTSFTDGKAPASFTKHYEFDLADKAKAPNTYAAK